MTNSSEDHKTKKKKDNSRVGKFFDYHRSIFFSSRSIYICKKALRARKHFKAGLHYITVTQKKKRPSKGISKCIKIMLEKDYSQDTPTRLGHGQVM